MQKVKIDTIKINDRFEFLEIPLRTGIKFQIVAEVNVSCPELLWPFINNYCTM